MSAYQRYLGYIFFLLSSCAWAQASAQELLHFIEAGEYGRVMQKGSGIKIGDDGTVYLTSEEQGTLLKIVDGKIEAHKLGTGPFNHNKLGGVDLLPDGRLVIVNRGSSRVGIVDAGLESATLFSQSGKSAGELNDPQAVASSVNRKIYVAPQEPANQRVQPTGPVPVYHRP